MNAIVKNKIAPNWMPEPDAEHCPTCGEMYVRRCRCPLHDMVCANEHHWHRCAVHGNVVNCKADHTLETYRCRCRIGDTESGCIGYLPSTFSND